MPLINVYLKHGVEASSVIKTTDSLIEESIRVFDNPQRKLSAKHFLVTYRECTSFEYCPNDIQYVFMLHDFEDRIANAHVNADTITERMKHLLPSQLSVGTWIMHGHFGKSADTR